MKYAETIADIPNAFALEALETEEDLERFYYDGTMPVRTGDPSESPIQRLYMACKNPYGHDVFLLLGHRGCGKSTELNEMSLRLKKEGYPVTIVYCTDALDTSRPRYTDLLIHMGNALIRLADEYHCALDAKTLKSIQDFWADIERTKTITDGSVAEAEASISAETPEILLPIVKLFAKVTANLTSSEQNQTIYRERIDRRSKDWIEALDAVANQIAAQTGGHKPIVIFEDLEKLDPETVWTIFFEYARPLSGVSFPVIYTFPIALFYQPKFFSLDGPFEPETFPMIKLEESDGTPCQLGYDTIMEILKRRVDRDLFEPEALDLLIRKTGGSLRDLFQVINWASFRAYTRGSEKIQMSDAKRALVRMEGYLTRMLEEKQYGALATIYQNHEKIGDREIMLELLQAHAVLEYNGKRWHNVHPLVADFLKRQGAIQERQGVIQ